MEKNPMHYRVQARNLRTGELVEVIRATREQMCFADMALRNMDENLRVHEFDWHFEAGNGENRSTVEEVKEMVHHFFGEDQLHGMTIEFLGKSEVVDVEREVVRFSNMGEYPRGLFMAKLFTIRNLNRYCESYIMYQKLVQGGVPKMYAAVIGSTVHSRKDFRGNIAYTMRDYARTINQTLHTMDDWKRHAENDHKGTLGYKWGDPQHNARGGYNFSTFDGAEKALHMKVPPVTLRVKDFLSGIGVNQYELTWKGVVEISVYLTGMEELKSMKEPIENVEKAKPAGLNPNRFP